MNTLKKLISTVALALVAVTASAQQDDVVFAPHLKLQLQGGAGYTVGETSSTSDLTTFAAALNLGYEFTPIWGARVGVSGLKGSGYVRSQSYNFNYVQFNLDATFDICNALCGYKYDRFVNPYVFAGIGYNSASKNDEAIDIAASGANMDYLWNDTQSSFVGRFGVGADFMISESVAINAEVNANALSDKFNSKKAGNSDWQINALVGLTINLGKSHKKVAKAAPYVAPAPAPAPAPKVVVEEKKPEVVEVVAVFEDKEFNIFFDLDSYEITPEGNNTIKEIIAYVNDNPEGKITLTGYADKNTGYPKYNESISKKRVDAVSEAFVNGGISSNKISISYKGDTVQPFSDNDKNRVVVGAVVAE